MADQTDTHLGRRLRQRRWMLGLTQSQVGDRVGIKFQQVQKYETGQNRISASRLWELAQALDVPISYFYEGLAGEDDAVEGEAALAAALAEEAGGARDSADAAAPRLSDRETVDLLRAYFAMPELARRRVLDLIRALSRLDIREPAEPVDTPELKRTGS